MQEQHGWWDVFFDIKWSEGTEPLWHVDLLLAHKVLSHVLEQFRPDFEFWQFHRRAAPDEHGHEFTFSFYSSSSVAPHVYTSVHTNRLLQELRDSGVITQVTPTNPIQPASYEIESKSNPTWSDSIRKSWPHFIKGVCEMWLALIDETINSSSTKAPSQSLTEMLAEYREANRIVSAIWSHEGQHALLHHLNAIFGYVPVMIQGQFSVRF